MKKRKKVTKSRTKAKAAVAKLKGREELKLDLGCGQNKAAGFKGVDKFEAPGVDYVHDLTKFPWPFKDNSVDEIHCSHFLEHVPGLLRGKFMDEVFRILRPKAKATFIVPAYNSERAIQDFTHEWPPIGPSSFAYFTKAFRDGNRLTHGYYDLKCDFEQTITGSIDANWSQRELGVQQHAARYNYNVVIDYTAILVKPALKSDEE